ncbi:hypothetical protein NDU88_002513 [Pleurodeles waltl]|uniref:Uncharacterized protein n=1 Tax=Pleurodeles waltl TaxID=8319 RepID=A0AAV7UBR6_PLEWA|nr:hypothetical protein NDU88_002513 [Pleurodeles waltl]
MRRHVPPKAVPRAGVSTLTSLADIRITRWVLGDQPQAFWLLTACGRATPPLCFERLQQKCRSELEVAAGSTSRGAPTLVQPAQLAAGEEPRGSTHPRHWSKDTERTGTPHGWRSMTAHARGWATQAVLHSTARA